VSRTQKNGERASRVGIQELDASAIPSNEPTLRSLRVATEVNAISTALEQTGWNRKRAAKLLGISYRGLFYKIHQHNIVRQADVPLTPVAEKQ